VYNRSSKKKHLYKEKYLRKETLYANVDSHRATTSVLADYRAAADQHPQPLRHHQVGE